MAYGLIYQSAFDQLSNDIETYSYKIYKKDYTGIITNVLFSGEPAKQQWTTDDPKPPIKGSNLEIEFINDEISLSDFFSVEDDTFLGEFYWQDRLLFKGFLVQTDCTEIQIDIRHKLSLSFTDNLGLLKNVSLSQAADMLGVSVEYDLLIQRLGGGFVISGFPAANVGDVLTVSGSGVFQDGVYHITDVITAGPLTFVTTQEQLQGAFGVDVMAHLKFVTPVDLSLRYPIKEFLRLCLLSTNLSLNTNVFANLQADGGVTGRLIEDVYLSGNTFLNGESYLSCYDVLTELGKTFQWSLFQSNGEWNIVRWHELRQYGGQTPCTPYAANFANTYGYIRMPQLGYGQNGDIETGLLGSILRPYKYVKETFEYKQPPYLNNANLSSVGALISTSTDIVGADTIRTDIYEFPARSNWKHFNNDGSKIVVKAQVLAYSEVEKERYVYQNKISVGTAQGFVEFNDIEVNAGDEMDFSFSIKTASGTSGDSVDFFLAIDLMDETGHFYSLVNSVGTSGNDFRWNGISLPLTGLVGGASIVIHVLPADATEYTSVKLSDTGRQGRVPRFPEKGLLKIRMYGTNTINTSQPNVDAIWKDLNLSIINYVSDSTKVIAQTHTHKQSPTINNNEEIDLTIDDSPLNNINGTLYLSTFTNLVQDRTTTWNRGGITENKRLGEITTFEELFWRKQSRNRYEGTVFDLIQEKQYFVSGTLQFVFITGENRIIFSDKNALDFPIGGILVITGTASNDGTYTINYATQNTTFVTVTVDEPVVNEGPLSASATITYRFHLTMLNVIKYYPKILFFFICGSLTIDYRAGRADLTLWEMYKEGEIDDGFIRDYQFKYLYDNK